uniref:crAss001_48 related protein n=1 Tax=Segatella hominis TaxID=2518605 RepID=UPI0040270643
MEETTLKQYIGTKTVKAEPMVKSAAVAKGWARASEGNPDTPGYHVQYTNPDGSTYDSWSPKDVFEKSYQIAEDFKDRLEIEFKELRIRLLKLHKFIQDNGFANIAKKIGPEQGALLLSQYHGMNLYFDALKARLEILNSESEDK